MCNPCPHAYKYMFQSIFVLSLYLYGQYVQILVERHNELYTKYFLWCVESTNFLAHQWVKPCNPGILTFEAADSNLCWNGINQWSLRRKKNAAEHDCWRSFLSEAHGSEETNQCQEQKYKFFLETHILKILSEMADSSSAAWKEIDIMKKKDCLQISRKLSDKRGTHLFLKWSHHMVMSNPHQEF